MSRVFSYPIVKEIRSSDPRVLGEPVPVRRPAATQRDLVEASLLRCPDPRVGASKRP